jgi:hypothetical protein
MTLHDIIDIASTLSDEELQELDFWIRHRLDPAAAELEHPRSPTPGEEEEGATYKLKYFRCGKSSCRCARGELHGPYLYIHRRGADGRARTTYVGRVSVERQDEDRQLELDLR